MFEKGDILVYKKDVCEVKEIKENREVQVRNNKYIIKKAIFIYRHSRFHKQ